MTHPTALATWFLAVMVSLAGCSPAPASRADDSSDGSASTPAPAEAPDSTTDSVTETSPIVGEWQRETTCEQRVRAFEDAGLGQYAAESVAGDGFIPGVNDVADLDDPARPCVGAVATQHGHFFTADGEFGSRDADGNQVDDGEYRMVGSHGVEIGSFEGWVRFRYAVEGDTLRLYPVLPKCARNGCFDAQWAVSVSYNGLPWKKIG